MLLYFYLGTTAVNLITVFIFNALCQKRLKRDEYKYVKPKKTFVDKIGSIISTALKCFISVYSIINTIAIFSIGDKLYGYMKNNLLEEEKIYMPKDETANTQSEMEPLSFEKEQKDIEVIQKFNDEKKDEEKGTYLERETNISNENFEKHTSKKNFRFQEKVI